MGQNPSGSWGYHLPVPVGCGSQHSLKRSVHPVALQQLPARKLCFLGRVKGFSHSTITLHKSVVATFANPDRSAALSSHPIIRLKGSFASEVRPENHYLGCPAVRILAGTKSAEPNLFQVSRHVACLLLLASGRRVHDLTLLSTAEDLFQDLGEVLVFRPRLWSKTNSGSHQQSGWRLSGMTSSPSLDVVR